MERKHHDILKRCLVGDIVVIWLDYCEVGYDIETKFFVVDNEGRLYNNLSYKEAHQKLNKLERIFNA